MKAVVKLKHCLNYSVRNGKLLKSAVIKSYGTEGLGKDMV